MIKVKENYKNSLSELKDKLKVSSIYALPKLEKVVISSGIGKLREQKDILEDVTNVVSAISGQKPKLTTARKSIAGFKLREGEKVGLSVTLRNKRMYNFLDRLVNIILPRLRDFRGLESKWFDGRGNMTIGFRDLHAFAEIDPALQDKKIGLAITLVISRSDPTSSETLLKNLGFPFRKS